MFEAAAEGPPRTVTTKNGPGLAIMLCKPFLNKSPTGPAGGAAILHLARVKNRLASCDLSGRIGSFSVFALDMTARMSNAKEAPGMMCLEL